MEIGPWSCRGTGLSGNVEGNHPFPSGPSAIFPSWYSSLKRSVEARAVANQFIPDGEPCQLTRFTVVVVSGVHRQRAERLRIFRVSSEEYPASRQGFAVGSLLQACRSTTFYGPVHHGLDGNLVS